MSLNGNELRMPSYWTQLFFLMLIIFSSSLLFTVISILVIKVMYQVSFLDIQNALASLGQNSQAVMPVKIIQLLSSIGTFVIPSFVFMIYKRENASIVLKINQFPPIKLLVMGILLILFSAPLITLTIELNKQMIFPDFLKNIEYWMRMQEKQLEEVTRIFLEMNSLADLLINLLVIGIVPAIGEELLFRGVGQRLFGEWTKNIHWGIWISAFLFGAIHLQFYSFLPRMILGAVLGYMFYWSGNLWVPIAGHFFNNGSQVLLAYLFQRGLIKTNIDEMDSFPLYITVIFSVLFAGVLFQFYKSRTE